MEDAPLIMKWLCDLGTILDREEDGSFVEKAAGGLSRKRMHACRDYTGLEELRVIEMTLETGKSTI